VVLCPTMVSPASFICFSSCPPCVGSPRGSTLPHVRSRRRPGHAASLRTPFRSHHRVVEDH
jgi:hypothetical protein